MIFFPLYIKSSSLILDTTLLPDVVCGFFSLSVCSLSVHLLNRPFHRGKVFNIDEVQFMDFFSFLKRALGVTSENSL